MALFQSPRIITDGLVFAYDMGNGKSNVGATLTNLLLTPSVNGYPTIGNSWGTYNTNQYNSATYFSIGTISSVSSNIVTTSTNHPLRTYDVVTPQTTGGGVTAGTNYLVKKLSDTTFCLYSYNNSQDGSQGYINPLTGNHKVYDALENDTKISINSSSFPTMWWGPPHLPNSGLVKEIITKGFNGIPGRQPTDCMRLHYIRSDNVKDGMAYGADATVTAGVAHTVSFWTKSVDPGAVGATVTYQIYNYGDGAASGYSFSFTLGPVGVWQKQSMTFTPTDPYCISYWFGGSGAAPYTYKWDLANIQFETGSVANQFAPGTRSTTQALVDQTSNYTITAVSPTYYSDNTFKFKGSGQRFDTNLTTFGNNATWEAWIYCDGSVTTYNMFMGRNLPYFAFWGGVQLYFSNVIGGTQRNIGTAGNLASNTWYHATFTTAYDGTNTTMKIYTNAVETATGTFAGAQGYDGSYSFSVGDGQNASWYRFDGQVPVVRVYNRTLSAAEVQQNFNALRGRFGV